MVSATKITEELDWSSTAIDEEAGIVRGVKLIGTVSSNGRKYPADVLSAAKPMYEGFGIDLDHVEQGSRKVEQGFGRARNVVQREDGLYADVEYLKSHPFAAQFVERAKRMPEQLGMSHSVFAEIRKDGDTEVVESIERLDSLDLVRRPATTKGLFESKKNKPVEKTELSKLITSIAEDDSLSDEQVEVKWKKHFALTKKGTDPPYRPAGQAQLEINQEFIKEAIAELTKQNASLLARFERVDCLTTNDIDRTQLTEDQIQEFESKKTREEMDSFVESLPKVTKHSQVSLALSGGQENRSYKEQRESLEKTYRFTN